MIKKHAGTARSLSSSGYVRRTTACPRRDNGCDPAPDSKRMIDSCACVLCLIDESQWAMTVTRCGEPWTPGRAEWPARLFVVAECTCAGQRYLRGPSGALSTRHHVDGVAGRIKEVSYYHRVTPCGLVT